MSKTPSMPVQITFRRNMETLHNDRVTKVLENATSAPSKNWIRTHILRFLRQMSAFKELKPTNYVFLHFYDIMANAVISVKKLTIAKAELVVDRTWIHVDMDAFYAAVEMRDDASLVDKPLAIGDRNMILTTNYVARKHGVRSGVPGFIGKKLCEAQLSQIQSCFGGIPFSGQKV